MYSAEASRLAPGTRLNGIFEIDQRIASGGMGEIYRGHTIETGDPVAIKVMRTDLADNMMALALFRKEASALHNIHHEAIVRYYIFSNDPGTGRHYLAMEFVDGQPLSDLLQRGPLGFDAVCLLQGRLAAGLNAVHRHGIIHRDLSPDNVLIPGGDLAQAKIIDFGIARSTRGSEGTIIGSGFAGKYNYVSPEQLGLFGGNVTTKSDVYSLGLVLAQCLTGQPIDMGGTQFEIMEKRRVVPDLKAIDRRFRPLLEKMLQPNPTDRPQSMAAVAAWRPEPESRPPPRAAADRGQGARLAAADRPKLRPRRRFAKLALALVLLLGVGGGSLYIAKDLVWPREKEQPKPRSGPLRQRIIDFINAYDGGDCFFVAPVLVEDGKVRLEGLARAEIPFEVLNSEFIRQFGFEATIAWGPVSREQCPAVNFLARTKSQPGVAPRLDIDTTSLQSGGRVTGSVAEFGDRHVVLLLIGDGGRVLNLTERLRPSGNTKTFSFEAVNDILGSPGGQIPLVIVSSKPLEALKLPLKGPLADQVFTKVLAEARQTSQALNVSWKYFML